jgi:hypothetical protein
MRWIGDAARDDQPADYNPRRCLNETPPAAR